VGVLIAATVLAVLPRVAHAETKMILLPGAPSERDKAAATGGQIRLDRDRYLARMSLQKGAEYLREGRYAEAKAEMEWVLTVQPDNSTARKILTEAQAELAKILDATPADKEAGDALKQNRLEMECRYYEGNSFLAEGKYDEAIRRLEMAVAIGRTIEGSEELFNAAALLKNARDHRNAMTSEEAVAARKQAQKLVLAYDRKRRQRTQQQARVLFERAKKYYNLREFEKALYTVNAVTGLDEKYPGARFLKNKILLDGKKELAAATARDKKRSHDDVFAGISKDRIWQSELIVYPETFPRHNVPKVQIPATEETGPAVDAIKDALRKKISCEFNGATLAQAVGFLQKTSGCNMVIDPRTACKDDPVNSLSVADTEMVHVLNMLCRLNNVKWALKDEAIVISDREIDREKIMELYEVADLCVTPRSFASGGLSMTAGIDPEASDGDGRRQAAHEESLAERNKRGQELVDLIKNSIAHGTWDEEGGSRGANTIQYRSGKLVVSHNEDVHRKILKLLDAFRRERAIQVSILTRYVDINKDYLERAGIDWTGLDNLITRGISAEAQNAGGNRLRSGAAWQGSDRIDEFGIPMMQAWWYRGTEPDPLTSPGSFGPTRGSPGEPPFDPALGRRPWPALMEGGSRPGGYLDLRGSNVNRNTVSFPGQLSQWNEFGGLFLDIAFLSRYQVHALIEAVEKEKQGSVLTSPRITCFNGQRANIVLARLINYIQTYDDTGAPTIATITDGVVLEAKPYVSADRRYVTMELLPSITELGGFETILVYREVSHDLGYAAGTIPIELPSIFIRSVETTVSVPDGGTILIGGLSKATEQEGYASVPLLSKIPVIKYLFMNWGRIDRRTSLVMLVTANILIQSELEPEIATSE